MLTNVKLYTDGTYVSGFIAYFSSYPRDGWFDGIEDDIEIMYGTDELDLYEIGDFDEVQDLQKIRVCFSDPAEDLKGFKFINLSETEFR